MSFNIVKTINYWLESAEYDFETGKSLVDPRLQPVPISSESFDRNTWIPLVHQIKAYGIEIKAA